MMPLVLSAILLGQSLHMPPLAGNFEGPQCAEDDHDCLLRALDWHVRMSEQRRLALEHCDASKLASEQQAAAESSAKMAWKEEAERRGEPPSRAKWFLLGAAGSLVLTLGLILAAH